MNLKEIELDLGNGRKLVALLGTNPDYPSIDVFLRTASAMDELVSYVECIRETGKVRTIAFEGEEENPSSIIEYASQYSIQR